jgi:hypothetical protein
VEEIVQSLDATAFGVIVAFLVGMGGIALAAGLQARRRASLIEATRTSQIGSAQDGYREFEGTIEAPGGSTLAAPLTGWRVCWYRAKVEEQVLSTRQRGSGWRSIRSETSVAPFLLRDSTGVCVVHPADAEVTPTDKSRWYGKGPEPEDRNPPRLAPTQSSTPVFEIADGTNHRYRYTEERIYAGDPLLVLGQFSRRGTSPIDDEARGDENGQQPDPEDEPGTTGAAGLDDEAAIAARAARVTSASIGKAPGKPLILSTTPQASHLAMTEFGSEAAVYVALIPFGLAALLLWTRFS